MLKSIDLFRLGALATWGGLYVGVVFVIERYEPSLIPTLALMAAPIVMFAAFLWLTVVRLRREDEMEQRVQANALMIAFGVSLIAVMILAMAERAELYFGRPEDMLLRMFFAYLGALVYARSRYTCGLE